MTGIPPHRDPGTEAEREIAAVMTFASRLVEAIHAECPWLPESAISVGLINYGAQIGCRSAAPTTVAGYLRGVASIIAPVN